MNRMENGECCFCKVDDKIVNYFQLSIIFTTFAR